MSLALTLGMLAAAVATAAALGILTSRTAIEKLVAAGVLPPAVVNLYPVMTVAVRALAVALLAAGLVRLGIVTGVLMPGRLEEYAPAAFLIVLGATLLFLTRQRPDARR